MSTIELKKQLIDKINHTEDQKILEEAYRLLELESSDMSIYMLNEVQKLAVLEAKEQINQGAILTNLEANKEIDEWLNK